MLNKYASAISAYGTASGHVHPMDGVILLYEKGLTHLSRAARAREERRFEDFAKEIERAVTIMTGLDSMLDMRRGGEIASEMHDFYIRMIRLCGFTGGRRRPGVVLASIIRQWSAMLETWREVARTTRRQDAAGRSAVPPPPGSRPGALSILG